MAAMLLPVNQKKSRPWLLPQGLCPAHKPSPLAATPCRRRTKQATVATPVTLPAATSVPVYVLLNSASV